MSHYLTIGVNDFANSTAFYDAVLGAIGWASHAAFDGWRAYSQGGTGEGLVIWVCEPFNGAPGSAGNGTMVGLEAASRAEVDAFHAAALALGGQDEGAPGIREHYGPNWYGAYVRDPVGNKLAAFVNR